MVLLLLLVAKGAERDTRWVFEGRGGFVLRDIMS